MPIDFMGRSASLSADVPWEEVINLLSELVVFKHYSFEEFLNKLILVILKIVPVDSSLIYIYDREKKELRLVGSKTPHEKLLDHIIIKKGIGITGWVAEHKESVAISKEAYKDPRFIFIKELPEDKYEGFLSIPIVDLDGVIGVINLQSRLPYEFSAEQIHTVGAIVKIIASAFAKIVLEKKVGQLENKLKERQLIEEAKGVLMKAKNIDENAAYHYIRKEAMSKRKSMREIAEAVLLVLK